MKAVAAISVTVAGTNTARQSGQSAKASLPMEVAPSGSITQRMAAFRNASSSSLKAPYNCKKRHMR